MHRLCIMLTCRNIIFNITVWFVMSMGRVMRKLSWLRVVVLSVVILAPLAIPALVFSPQPALADPDPGWYSANWSYRKKIIINSNNVTATLSDFPVLVSLPSDSDLASDALNNGNDILFTADNGTTKLAHEIESFNGSSGNLTAWVKVSSLSSSTDTTLYMYYGDATAGNQSDTQDVWDANFMMVQHMKDTTTSTITDSTSNDKDGTKKGAGEPAVTTSGKIANAQDFAGDDDYITAGDITSLTSITISAWVYREGWDDDAGSSYSGIVWRDAEYGMRLPEPGASLQFFTHDGDWDVSWTESVMADNSTWYYAVCTYNGTNASLYIDGSLDKTIAQRAMTNSGNPLYIGMQDSTGTWNGIIDEVRISDTARSADWIETSYNNHNFSSDFVTVGVEQSQTQRDNWKSYNDAAHETQDDTFSGDQNTVYMHGTNFTTGTEYKVAFYDAEGSLSADAHKLQTDSVYADGDDGGLSASCAFTSYKATADPGTWHAVTCAVAQTPPDTYNEAWEYEITDDSFTVEGSAIPEFPTVFTAIGATGLCFGIYYWMRNRRIKAVGRIQ